MKKNHFAGKALPSASDRYKLVSLGKDVLAIKTINDKGIHLLKCDKDRCEEHQEWSLIHSYSDNIGDIAMFIPPDIKCT